MGYRIAIITIWSLTAFSSCRRRAISFLVYLMQPFFQASTKAVGRTRILCGRRGLSGSPIFGESGQHPPPMKFFRYRRPSLKTILGITSAKKRIKKDLGITSLLKPFRWLPNQKRRLKREVGYESPVGRLIRDGLPRPEGCLVVLVGGVVGLWWMLSCTGLFL